MTSMLTSGAVTTSRPATEIASRRVVRFNRTQRLVHATQALTFLLLLFTGLVISITTLETMFGHRALFREIHLATAFFFVFGPALITIAGDRLSMLRDLRSVETWSKDDVEWLAHPSANPGAATPPAGRYNAGQKLNAIFTIYSTLAFGVTGLILWQNRRFPFELVSQANTVHTWLAYLALVVFLGHLYLSAVHPATRASFHGIVFGTVGKEWAQHHHPAWSPPDGAEGPINRTVLAKALSLLVAGSVAAALLSRAGLELLGANVTDPVIHALYRVTSFPGTSTPVTASHVFDLAALVWLGLAICACYAIARGDSFLPRVTAVSAKG